MLRLFVLAIGALCIAFVTVNVALAANYNQRNARDQYRWPWRYNDTWTFSQGQFNTGTGQLDTHTVAKKLEYAIDVYSTPQSPVWAAREGVVHCEDWRQVNYKFGFVQRVVHGSDSDFYAHADQCWVMGSVSVAQGRHIAYTGTTGVNIGDFGDHLHFMRATTTTSTYSASVTMEGVSSFPHPTVVGYTATSDNLSAGYTVPDTSDSPPSVQWEPAIHTKAYALGWSTAGATAYIGGWTPGRSAATTCGSGSTPGWYQCNFTDINGTSRQGRIQTFKGAGTPSGEHAIFKRSSAGAASFMSRGLLGPYTDLWSGSHDGTRYLGYPVGDSFNIGGTMYQMNFENGYATFNNNGSCDSRWYYWSAFLGFYVEQSLANYCD